MTVPPDCHSGCLRQRSEVNPSSVGSGRMKGLYRTPVACAEECRLWLVGIPMAISSTLPVNHVRLRCLRKHGQARWFWPNDRSRGIPDVVTDDRREPEHAPVVLQHRLPQRSISSRGDGDATQPLRARAHAATGRYRDVRVGLRPVR